MSSQTSSETPALPMFDRIDEFIASVRAEVARMDGMLDGGNVVLATSIRGGDPETGDINITLNDLEVLRAAASQQMPDILQKMDALVQGYQGRIARQVSSINRLLLIVEKVKKIAYGGGSDGGKVIEIKKELP